MNHLIEKANVGMLPRNCVQLQKVVALHFFLSICHKLLQASHELPSLLVIISILPQSIKWVKQNSTDLVAKNTDLFIAVGFISFPFIPRMRNASNSLESMPKQLLLKCLKVNNSKLCNSLHSHLSTADYFYASECMLLGQAFIFLHLH